MDLAHRKCNMVEFLFLLLELIEYTFFFHNIDSTLAINSPLGVLLTFHINELLQYPFMK